MNKSFRSCFDCAEAFIIASYCGFQEGAQLVIANRHLPDWRSHESMQNIDIDDGGQTITIEQAMHAIQYVFSTDTETTQDMQGR